MPPGWYDDPHEFGWLRYWDGTSWSRETAPRPAAFVATEPPPPYASFGERLLAYVIDMLILTIPVSMVISTAWIALNPELASQLLDSFSGGEQGALSNMIDAESGPILLATIAMGPIWFCYAYLTLRKWSATIGMRALRLKVIAAGADNVPPGSAARRAAVFGVVELAGVIPVIGTLISVVFLVDCLSMIWNPERRTWHDRWANTTVVKLPRQRSSSTAIGSSRR